MNILKMLVQELNNDELRHYKFYSKRRNREADRKDWKLLEIYRERSGWDDAQVAQKLYGPQWEANVFARLKNRLAEDINRALVAASLKEGEFEPWFYYLIFRYHDRRNRHAVAAYYLRKAVQKAEASAQYDLAVMLYHHQLRSARYRTTEHAEITLEKLRINEYYSTLLRKMEFHSALLDEELRRSQSLYESLTPLLEEAEAVAAGITEPERLPPPLLLQWLRLKSQILVLRHEYAGLIALLEPHLHTTLTASFEGEQQAELQASLILYLINAHTLQGAFDRVAQVAPVLEKLLQRSPTLAARYRFFYYQAHVAALCKTEKYGEALEVIARMEKDQTLTVNPRYQVFGALNKALCLYETRRWNEALKTLARLKTWEAFSETDVRLQRQAEILEILVRLLLDDMDYAFQRCKSLVREKDVGDEADKALLHHLVEMSRLSLREMAAYAEKIVACDPVILQYQERQVINYVRWAETFSNQMKK